MLTLLEKGEMGESLLLFGIFTCLLIFFLNIFYWNWASRVVTVQHKADYSLTSRHPTSAPCPLRQWSLTLGSETTCWAPDSFALLAATRQSKASLVVHHFLSTVTPGYWKLGFSTLDLMLTKRHQKEKITGTGKGVFTFSFSPVFCKSFPFALFPRMESPPPLWATSFGVNHHILCPDWGAEPTWHRAALHLCTRHGLLVSHCILLGSWKSHVYVYNNNPNKGLES